jgi:Tol biopolymer transport system component
MMLLRLRATLHPYTITAALVLSLSTGSAQAQLKFGPATRLLLGSAIDPYGSTLSSDGLTLYFDNASVLGSNDTVDIWRATRSSRFGSFESIVNLGSTVNSAAFDGRPSISFDGLSMFFSSTRAGGLGDRDIYIATRANTNDNFGTPVSLGNGVNSIHFETGPSISADGLTLFFQSDRPGGHSLNGIDIYTATRSSTSVPFQAVANLGPTINGGYGAGNPSISADGLSLFFFSSADGATSDLYVSTRASVNGVWGAPVNLGPNANSPFDEESPDVAWDGKSIVFVSYRDGVKRLYEAAIIPEPSTLVLAVCSGVYLAVVAAHRRAEKKRG